jgi:hypothetical protein
MSKTGYVGCKNYTRLLVSLVERTTASDLLFCSDSILSYTNEMPPKTFQHPHHLSNHCRRQGDMHPQDDSLKPSPDRFTKS